VALGLGWPLSPSRPSPPYLERCLAFASQGWACTLSRVCITAKKNPRPYFFLDPIAFFSSLPTLTSLRPPSASTLSIHCVFFSPSLLSLFFHPLIDQPSPPSLPAGIILNFAFDDGATIKLPDPSTSQGGLSRIDAQPRRPAAHDIVLGYGNIISSRLSRRCQSRQ
jgi:hypothetical protein